jgi:small-conductance mechanosensitive channel
MQLDEYRGQVVGVLSRWLRPRGTIESQSESPEAVLAQRRDLTARRVALQDESTAAARLEQDRRAETERQASELRQILATTRQRLEKLAAEGFEAEGHAAQEEQARQRQLRQIETELAETADPQVLAFVHELQREADEIMRGAVVCFEVKNRLTDERRMVSNGSGLNARLSAIRQAIQAAQDLRLEALTADEVGERLQRLHEGLPTEEAGSTLGSAWKRVEVWAVAPDGLWRGGGISLRPSYRVSS